jgi:CRISPR system Cascade subunit CasD
MINVLILRLDAPLMAFGGVLIDQYGVTRSFPGRAMLTGLLANALGYTHGEAASLESLQNRLEYAVRCDRQGHRMVDYQTVDLGQEFLKEGWTTWGFTQGRAGGKARDGTHIRYRHYIADGCYTIALALASESAPGLDELELSLRSPERPLFIGRKPCIPSAPILLRRREVDDLHHALATEPLPPRADRTQEFKAWFFPHGANQPGALPITDDRDWANQIHVGRRWVREETIHV